LAAFLITRKYPPPKVHTKYTKLMRGIFITFTFLLLSFISFSQTIWSVQNGNWNNPETWNLDRIPNVDDFVKVNNILNLNTGGYVIDSLELNNSSGNDAILIVSCSGLFTITKQLNLFSLNQDGAVGLVLNANCQVEAGNIFVRRDSFNTTVNGAGLYLNQTSKLTSNGGFIYEYDGITNLEQCNEIVLRDDAELYIKGETNININSGNMFSFLMNNRAKFTCEGNFNYHFNHADSTTFNLNPNTIFVVHGEANFTNNSLVQQQLDLNFKGFSDFKSELNLTSNLAATILNLNLSNDKGDMTIWEKLGMY